MSSSWRNVLVDYSAICRSY